MNITYRYDCLPLRSTVKTGNIFSRTVAGNELKITHFLAITISVNISKTYSILTLTEFYT